MADPQQQSPEDRLKAVREIGLSALSAIDRSRNVVHDGQGERTLDAIARANAERVGDEAIDSTLRGELDTYVKLVAVADRAALLAAEIEAPLLPEGWTVRETIPARFYFYQGGNAQVSINKEADRGAMTIRVWGEHTWTGYAGDAAGYVPLAVALTRAQETLADPSSHLSPAGVEKVEAAKNKLDAQRAEVVSVMRESAREWGETADRYKNALLGERFIVIDKHERAFSQFQDGGESKIKLELPPATLTGVSFMTKENAEKAREHLERTLADCAPFAVWDFQQYAQQQAAKSADLALKAAEAKWTGGREAKNLREGKELAEVAMTRLGLPQPESWRESQGTLSPWEYADLDVGGYKKLTVGASAGGVVSIDGDPFTPGDRKMNVTLANVEKSLGDAVASLRRDFGAEASNERVRVYDIANTFSAASQFRLLLDHDFSPEWDNRSRDGVTQFGISLPASEVPKLRALQEQTPERWGPPEQPDRRAEISKQLAEQGFRMEFDAGAIPGEGHTLIRVADGEAVEADDNVPAGVLSLAKEWSDLADEASQWNEIGDGVDMAQKYEQMNKEQREFVDRVVEEGKITRDLAVIVTDKLGELSAMHLKLADIDLNVGLTGPQKAAQDAIENEIREGVRGLPGMKDAAFLYDPRGTTVGVQFESGAYNSFNGSWKVPLADGAVKALAADFWEKYVPKPDLTPDEPMESLSGAVMRLDRRSGMAEVVLDGQVTSFGGVPAIKEWGDERGISKADALRLYELDAQGSQRDELSAEAKAALAEMGDTGGYVVLTISNTANAAFADVGRDQEMARIVAEAADSIEGKAGLRDVEFGLRDTNGNKVGKVEYTETVPTGEPDEGTVRLSVKTGNSAFEGGATEEVARILREAADKVKDGEHIFVLRDYNGNTVGKFEFREEPSLDKDGVIDMNEALNSGRVYLGEDGFSGIADGEYRYVVTTPDFEPGYGQGEGDVWLVNAKGEIASGYEEPQSVRETLFRELKRDEKSDLRAVVEGRVSFEDFERRFSGEEPELG